MLPHNISAILLRPFYDNYKNKSDDLKAKKSQPALFLYLPIHKLNIIK